ncbi:hypothetical protein I302_103319 [Kwoniella bestiolae CBS 10118]|uniref:Cytoplasmic protein n=1 Tax=Kwoniella bestiolae CBS 10118 TaxID=1296100 RepID=A0A1B9G821_9TREE|nr:hypothetical protein I302_02022 [Kwoniella bestiolae CBS 10118]OCF27184.1 hypothetical protein I302_02022 [Kwoniella bestiolae CBS 10118]
MAYDLDPLPRTATPSDYTRFKFDPANVGDKRIVGLLACQRDPLLRSLKTRVHAVKEASIKTAPPPKGKGNKKKGGDEIPKEGKMEDKGKLYEVELLDTVIFPEGGGQPSDTGRMNVLDPIGGVKQSFVIESCLRRKLDSVHLVRIPPGTEVDLKEGDEVELVVDWDRRMDHMTIHTSQHLLSAVLDTMNLPTLSWSMHAHPSLEAPYVELPRSLTAAEAEEVERRCNDLIVEGNRVWVDVSIQGEDGDGSSDVDGQVVEGEVEERVKVGKGIPEDYDGGVIRHINIERTDRNACCGTQVPSLSLIQLMHIIPPTTSSSSATKLYFVAGPRAVRYLQNASRQLSSVAKIIGAGRADVVDRLEVLEKNRKDSFEAVKNLKTEISKSLIENALAEGGKEENKGVIYINRDNPSTHDFEFLGVVSTSYITQTEGEEPLIILLSGVKDNNQSLLLVHSSNDGLAKDINEQIKKGLGSRIKGGGARGRYMSKVEGRWGKDEVRLIEGIVHELRKRRLA